MTATDTAMSPAFTQALETVHDDLIAIPQAELARVQLDIPEAVVTVLGAAPEVRRLRPNVVATFGEAKALALDRLEIVARAAGQAHALFLLGTGGADLAAQSEAVIEVRKTLLTDAQALVNRKLVDEKLLAGLRGVLGYKNQCFDVLQLVGLFRGAWDRVKDHTPVKLEDLDRAETLAHRLAAADGLREQEQAGSSPAGDLRTRAYTLLVSTYDDVRQVVTYLRWKAGDAERIAPSLWAGRGRKHRPDVPSPTVAPSTPVVPPADNGPGGPFTA